MKKKLQRALALMLTFCLTMSVFCASVSATEGKTPYWQTTKEVDGVTQTITHAVLDSKGNPVYIGAEPSGLSAKDLDPGNMAAQKFGAFEDEADAANGIVKLTFDVVGKPIEVPGPLDVVIIADESGSLNMYGRSEQGTRADNNNKTQDNGPQNIRSSASYMPCLNGAHAYLVGDLQKELYQIALVRMVAAVGAVDESLAQAVADALAAEDQDAALAALLTDETTAVANAETALETAKTALAAAEEAHAPFAAAVEEAAAAVEAAENALEEAEGALAEEKAAVEAAQADVTAAQGTADGAKTAANEAKNTADAAQAAVTAAEAAVTAAEAALNEAPEEERETAQAVLDAANADLATANAALETANAALTSANTELETANTDLAAANTALAAAQSAYDEAYAANEAITAAETALNEKKTARDEAETVAQEIATAVADAKTAVDEAAAAVETAKASLEAKKATVDALVKVNEMESKLTEEAVAADIYINPHDAGLEYTVFGQWGNAGNEPAVRKMIKAAEFKNGDPANVEIPEILTDDDVYLALLSDFDTVALNSKGKLTFTTNYSTIQTDAETGESTETVTTKTKTREGWDPDTAHCHFVDGAYVLIEQPVNEDTVIEENKPYSYWSPDTDNDYGCYDRMIIEKEGIVSLAKQVLNADPNNNRVAYVGFTRGAYPSLSSFGLGDNGFCGLNDEDLDEMLSIMGNTNGHDYTNYIHPLYMARKIISMRADQSRPCYVVFISDGVPTTSGGYTKQAHVNDGGWNVLSLDNGDYPWYDDVYNNSDTHVEAAGKMAEYFKGFLEEVLGEDTGFYTVGFSTNETASELLASMSSDKNSFFNCTTVSDFLDKMQVVRQEIMTHYPSGTLTDVIGHDFELLIDRDHPFTVDGDKYYSQLNAAEDERVTFATADGETSVNSISWNLEQVDEKGVQISFYVKLTDEELNKFENGSSRIYDTNADTKDAAAGETVATGANLEYHELIVDNEKSEGYYAVEEATNLPLKTPQVKIWNGENTSENDPPQNDPPQNDPPRNDPPQNDPPQNDPPQNDPPENDPPENDPPEEMPDEDVPLGEIPDVDVPLEEILDEDVPLAEVPKTGDASAMWLILSALSGTGLAGVSVLNHKKRDED